jgi:epoxyqueuosine reductase
MIAELQFSQALKAQAARLGFDRIGIAPAGPSRYRDYFRSWLDDGRAGSMQYLSSRIEERTDPGNYLPGAQSVICVAMNYHVPLKEAETKGGPRGRIARYALGDDYHESMKARLHALADWMRAAGPESQTRCCVDTAPVMEKELAARTGIGWIGKNTCVINEEIGSWLLLGEIITTLALPTDDPAIDRCGTCRRCIDACPTGAITEPYRLDATRCISYLTIEHRDAIDPNLAAKFGDWLYGCDICQDVCPWNRKAPMATDPALAPRFPSGTLEINQVLQWTDENYRETLKGSAMKRVKLPMLKRNAEIVKRNVEVTKSAGKIRHSVKPPKGSDCKNDRQ